MSDITVSDQNDAIIDGTSVDDNITLLGSGSGDKVHGYAGSDIIRAGNGQPGPGKYTNTTVNAGSGNDSILNFGRGSTINAGYGDDYIALERYCSGIGVNAGDGNDEILLTNARAYDAHLSGGAGNDVIYDHIGDKATVETGGSGRDELDALGSGEQLFGQAGSDVLIAASSKAQLNGGDGADLLYLVGRVGTSGTNTLNGNGGNDTLADFDVGDPKHFYDFATTLIGGRGNDQITTHNVGSTMTGGRGKDLFIAKGDAFDQNGAVSITDFVHGEDHVVLSAEGASRSNYSEVKVSGGRAAAIAAAEGSGTAYTFVAGDDDGFLVYNDGSGNLTGVKIDGANQIADFGRSDIKTDGYHG